jgi:hypothetical protein
MVVDNLIYLNNTLPLNLVTQRKDDRSWSKASLIRSFITYHRIFNLNNTTSGTNDTRTANPSGSPPIVTGVSVAQSIVFCVVFWGPLFVFLTIIKPVHLTTFDYSVVIFKFWTFFLRLVGLLYTFECQHVKLAMI